MKLARWFPALLIVAGCGSSDVDIGTINVKSVEVSAARGALIEVSTADNDALAGTTLVIPGGSLEADTEITISYQDQSIADGTDSGAGPVAVFGPAGTIFRTGAILTLPYSLSATQSESELFMAVLEENGDRRRLAVTYRPDGLATALITGFTRYQCATGEDLNSCSNGECVDCSDPTANCGTCADGSSPGPNGACPDVDDGNDPGCDANGVCCNDPTTNGSCGDPNEDPCTNQTCGAGQYCAQGNCACPDVLCDSANAFDPATCGCFDPCNGCPANSQCDPVSASCICNDNTLPDASGSCSGTNACSANDACASGEICVSGVCAAVCNTDSDCSTNLVCSEGICTDGNNTCNCPSGQTCTANGGCACADGSSPDASGNCDSNPCNCPSGQSCDATTNQCYCSDGNPADPATGCGSNACTANSDCSSGEICSNGVCTGLCNTDSDCASGSVCIDATCAALCNADSDCGSNEVCNTNGTCGGGNNPCNCASGQSCDPTNGSCTCPDGSSPDASGNCNSNPCNCPSGQSCDPTNGSCVCPNGGTPDPAGNCGANACTGNADCASGEICMDSLCRQLCNADSDCGANETCVTGVCG